MGLGGWLCSSAGPRARLTSGPGYGSLGWWHLRHQKQPLEGSGSFCFSHSRQGGRTEPGSLGLLGAGSGARASAGEGDSGWASPGGRHRPTFFREGRGRAAPARTGRTGAGEAHPTPPSPGTPRATCPSWDRGPTRSGVLLHANEVQTICKVYPKGGLRLEGPREDTQAGPPPV